MKKQFTYENAIKILGICFAILFLISFFGGVQHTYNSDALPPDVIAEEVRTNGISGLRDFVAQQKFYQFDLLYWLPNLLLEYVTDAVLANRLVSFAFSIALLVIAWQAMRKLTDKNSAWIVIFIFGCGVSIEYTLYISNSMLQMHLLIMLIVLWIVGTFLKIETMSRKKAVVFSALASLYIIYVIAIDQRYAAIYSLPLIVSILFSYYVDVRINENLLGALKQNRKKLYIACCLLVCSLIGLAINGYLKNTLPFIDRLTDLNAGYWTFADLTAFFDALALYVLGILRIWGCDLSQGISTLSIQSIGYIIKGCACVICMVIVPILCAVQYKKLPEGMKVLVGMYFVLSAEVFYTYVLSMMNTLFISRYFMYELPLSIMISAWYFQEKIMKTPTLDRLVFICCISAFCFVSVISIYSYFKKWEANGILEEKEALVDTIEEDGVSYGYASYWNAQLLTTISDNNVKVRPVTFQDDIHPFFDIYCIHYFTPENYTGETFLLFEAAELQNILDNTPDVLTQLGEPLRILTSGHYYVYVYDHNIASDLSYFPYNEDYVPLDGSYETGETLISDESGIMEASDETEVVYFPVQLEPNSYYKLTFTAGTYSTPPLFYSDLFANGQYLPMQTAYFSIAEGSNVYEAVIPTGEIEEDNLDNTMLRFVSTPSSRILIDDICLQELEIIDVLN